MHLKFRLARADARGSKEYSSFLVLTERRPIRGRSVSCFWASCARRDKAEPYPTVAGIELAGESAEFVHGVDGEALESGPVGA